MKIQNIDLEKIAEIQHDIWINWMNYLFSISQVNNDGSYTIPVENVIKWKRLVNTPYDNLTEGEKESDREQAYRVLRGMLGREI